MEFHYAPCSNHSWELPSILCSKRHGINHAGKLKDHDAIVRALNARKTSKSNRPVFMTRPNTLRMLSSESHPIYFVSVSSSSPNCARCLATTLSCFLSRAALVFARLASISSFRTLSRAFSALARWICYNILVFENYHSENINIRAQPVLACA
jgi:hypothetical protein